MAEVYYDQTGKIVFDDYGIERVIFKETPNNTNLADFLMVGGGGTGYDSGGGAGGFIYNAGFTVTPGNYSIVVGLGGLGGFNLINQGDPTTFSGITAYGGGSGGGTYPGTADGGSGGGGKSIGKEGDGIAGQGHGGGWGVHGYETGGGGGAAFSGGTGAGAAKSGDGGDGIECDITGTPTYYAGGGGGGCYSVGEGIGGLGGGGRGSSYWERDSSTPGEPNTGGGAGGNYMYFNKYTRDGGSGIFVLRYNFRAFAQSYGGSKIINGDGSVIHIFNQSGTLTLI